MHPKVSGFVFSVICTIMYLCPTDTRFLGFQRSLNFLGLTLLYEVGFSVPLFHKSCVVSMVKLHDGSSSSKYNYLAEVVDLALPL